MKAEFEMVYFGHKMYRVKPNPKFEGFVGTPDTIGRYLLERRRKEGRFEARTRRQALRSVERQ